ncbi:hypothetical protein QVD17_06026 [Tagetes erecta]|uniref:Uncharacterized protein n=1 Tax=Tagetes erecta TaxID=13708 RepID=A0AAD8LJU0_TARER|nr:hypothetical protein QVD17_06026 [Tagetes erecta]
MGQSAPFSLYITPHFWTITIFLLFLFSFIFLDSTTTLLLLNFQVNIESQTVADRVEVQKKQLISSLLLG